MQTGPVLLPQCNYEPRFSAGQADRQTGGRLCGRVKQRVKTTASVYIHHNYLQTFRDPCNMENVRLFIFNSHAWCLGKCFQNILGHLIQHEGYTLIVVSTDCSYVHGHASPKLGGGLCLDYISTNILMCDRNSEDKRCWQEELNWHKGQLSPWHFFFFFCICCFWTNVNDMPIPADQCCCWQDKDPFLPWLLEVGKS